MKKTRAADLLKKRPVINRTIERKPSDYINLWRLLACKHLSQMETPERQIWAISYEALDANVLRGRRAWPQITRHLPKILIDGDNEYFAATKIPDIEFQHPGLRFLKTRNRVHVGLERYGKPLKMLESPGIEIIEPLPGTRIADLEEPIPEPIDPSAKNSWGEETKTIPLSDTWRYLGWCAYMYRQNREDMSEELTEYRKSSDLEQLIIQQDLGEQYAWLDYLDVPSWQSPADQPREQHDYINSCPWHEPIEPPPVAQHEGDHP